MPKPGFNMETFSAYARSAGFLKNAKYYVRFTLPPAMYGLQQPSEAIRRLEFYCSEAKLPGVQIATHDVSRFGYGVKEKKPVMPVFNEIPFIFYGDGQGVIWNFFYQWNSLVCNFDMRNGVRRQGSKHEPYELAYKYEYAVDMDVIALDEDGVEKIHIKLRDAFPFALGGIDLSWSAHNQIMQIPVVFAITDWYNAIAPPNDFNYNSVFN